MPRVKKPAKTAAERNRAYRARKKFLKNAANGHFMGEECTVNQESSRLRTIDDGINLRENNYPILYEYLRRQSNIDDEQVNVSCQSVIVRVDVHHQNSPWENSSTSAAQGQSISQNDIRIFKKTAKTPAERCREYRLRQKALKNVNNHHQEPPQFKKTAKTSSERVRKYRLRHAALKNDIIERESTLLKNDLQLVDTATSVVPWDFSHRTLMQPSCWTNNKETQVSMEFALYDLPENTRLRERIAHLQKEHTHKMISINQKLCQQSKKIAELSSLLEEVVQNHLLCAEDADNLNESVVSLLSRIKKCLKCNKSSTNIDEPFVKEEIVESAVRIKEEYFPPINESVLKFEETSIQLSETIAPKEEYFKTVKKSTEDFPCITATINENIKVKEEIIEF